MEELVQDRPPQKKRLPKTPRNSFSVKSSSVLRACWIHQKAAERALLLGGLLRVDMWA